MIKNWASSIQAEHLFLLKVVVIDDQLIYLEVALLHKISIFFFYKFEYIKIKLEKNY